MKIINHFLDIVQLKEIPDEGLNLIFDEKKQIEDVVLLSNIKGEASFERIKEDILLKGKFSTCINLVCDRCLEDFTFDIIDNFIYTILNSSKSGLKGDDSEIIYFDGTSINFLDIIHEQIILQIPHKIICSENCMGICPVCGKNLNFEHCSCGRTDGFNPFEKLKKII